MSGTAFLDHFSTLDDPRQAWKVVYPLSEILLLVLCGIMAGAETFVEIERWGEGKLGFLRRLRPLARGIPAHDTRNDVMNALPARGFAECFKQIHRRAETWRYAEYVLVFSSWPQSTGVQVLAWYRVRWPVERAIKRLKSLLGFGHLPKHDTHTLARGWMANCYWHCWPKN